MAVGLGGEQLWLSPTVANNVNPFDDQSGNSNNGTGQGGISTVSDSASGGSYAYDFDGVGDFIQLPVGVVTTTGSLTISAWVEHTNTTGSKAYVSDWDSAATKRSVLFGSNTGNHLAYFSNNGSSVTQQITGSAVTTTWTHVLLSQKAGTGELEFYKNGILDDTGGPYIGRYNSGTPWLVGALGAVGSYQWFFDGKMDDIRAFNRLLTQSEITHLATSRGVLGPPGGATHYNPFKSHAFINDFQQRLR